MQKGDCIMTDKTIRPQNQINFGGVQLNKNDIVSKRKVKENGATRYIVNMANGTTIKYPHQAAKNKSSIMAPDPRCGDFDSGYVETSINRLYGVEFTGNPDRADVVRLNGCRNSTVDISNSRSCSAGGFYDVGDRVLINDDGRYKSSGNKIVQDYGDKTMLSKKDKSFTIEGKGTHIEGQE